jgi:hypothetical protein
MFHIEKVSIPVESFLFCIVFICFERGLHFVLGLVDCIKLNITYNVHFIGYSAKSLYVSLLHVQRVKLVFQILTQLYIVQDVCTVNTLPLPATSPIQLYSFYTFVGFSFVCKN